MIDLKNIDYVSQLKKDLDYVFSEGSGERVMEFLEYICGFWHPGYVPNDPTSIMLSCGKREVILSLKTIMKLSPEQIVQYKLERE